VQSTLLAIAIAVIIVLVTALVGPLFIDWGSYRSTFETEASRLVGMPVRITGPIDARILPSPMVSLGDIQIGAGDPSSRLRAQSLQVELALGSLVRGQWRAAALHLNGPEFNVGLDWSGHVSGIPLALTVDPEQVAIDRLVIENGSVTLRDAASGARLVLEQLWFHGDVRSLLGPIKGEGAFVSSGQLYGYNLITQRVGEDGGAKLRLSIDPADRPLAIETEGTLWVEKGSPRYEGAATLARPVGVALAGGKKLVSEPWHLSSRIRANATAALFEQFEFQYGPEERGVKLTGTADVQFGARPHFDGVLSARQLDLDRSFAPPEGASRLPLATLREFAASLGDAIRPPIPVKLGIGIDALTVGGSPLQAVRGDIASDGDAWNLETFEFRAPGLTEVKLSGRLKVNANATEFVGPAAVDSSDPSALVAWIEGLSEAPKMAMGSLRVRGDMTLGSERIAIERLRADADRKTFEGRLAYIFPAGKHPARLDAALRAPEIDVDAAIAFATAALAGSKLEKPGEIAVAIDVGRATYGGVDAKGAAANVEFDGDGIRVERLSVSDLAGAALNASGRIDASSSPRGALTLTLDARKLDGVAALAAKFAPGIADKIQAFGQHAASAKLNATLNVQPLAGESAKSAAKLTVDGTLGSAHLNVSGDAKGELSTVAATDARLEGVVDSEDGGSLIAMLGLDRVLAVERRPSRLTFVASGSTGSEIRVESKMTATGLESALTGTMRLSEQSPKANFEVSASAADVIAFRRDPATPAPVTLKTKIVASGDAVSLRDLTVGFAGSTLRGQLGLTLGSPIKLDGRIAAETIDLPAVMSTAFGMHLQSGPQNNLSQWPIEPFPTTLWTGFEGKIPFYAVRTTLLPGFVAQQIRGVVHFDPSGVAIEDGEGNLAEGRLQAQADLHRRDNGVAAHCQISLSNADAAILSSNTSLRSTGRLTAQIEAQATGLSPATFIGALSGTGSISVENAQFGGVDPTAIDAAIAAVDRGLPVDSPKVGDVVAAALDAGKLNIQSATGTISISAGRMRITSASVPAQGADVSLNAFLDLVEQGLDARVTLLGTSKANTPASGRRPELSVVLKGPIDAPRKTIDLPAFVGWLTLRSVERETKRLEDIQGKEPGNVGSSPGREGSRPRPPDKPPDLPPPVTIRPSPPPKVARPP
jgi:uncharacterized protein involved in outer membrane biogenesis